MSKVKKFVGQKSKAIHRMRRYESRKKNISRKKLVPIKPYLYKGYCLYGEDIYVIQNDVQTQMKIFYEDWIIRKGDDKSYLLINGNWLEIVGYRKPHIKRVNHGRSRSYYSNQSSRRFRREKIDVDSSIALKGGEYKKNYDVAWLTD